MASSSNSSSNAFQLGSLYFFDNGPYAFLMSCSSIEDEKRIESYKKLCEWLKFLIGSFINKLDLFLIRLTNMVQALIELDENTNRTLNVVKAKYNLRDKGEAIKFVVSEYIESEEPELRP